MNKVGFASMQGCSWNPESWPRTIVMAHVSSAVQLVHEPTMTRTLELAAARLLLLVEASGGGGESFSDVEAAWQTMRASKHFPMVVNVDTCEVSYSPAPPQVKQEDGFDPADALRELNAEMNSDGSNFTLASSRQELFKNNNWRSAAQVDFENLNVTLNSATGKRVLLDNVSGHALQGQVLAIMGSSGAGKTTLMNMISGRLASSKTICTSGSVLVNGAHRN